MDQPWEDNLLECKLESDLKDLLKTLVAFSNSVRPGHTAVILIGEANDGTVQGVKNPDNIQKKVRDTCDSIYPPILWRSLMYQKENKPCIRIEIEYDGETPHFGGKAWVRKGSTTKEATDEVFQRLIDYRSSKVHELANWFGKKVLLEPDLSHTIDTRLGESYQAIPRLQSPKEATLGFMNNFWVTFDINGKKQSEPLDKLILSWDDTRNILKILVKP